MPGCWAHVRLKFRESLESSPRLAGWILRQVQHRHAIEARLRESKAGPALASCSGASDSFLGFFGDCFWYHPWTRHTRAESYLWSFLCKR